MIEVQKQIRTIVADLIRQKKVDYIIGYEKGSIPRTSRPCIIDVSKVEPGVSEKLVWDRHCSNNLSVYLQDFFSPPVPGRKSDETPPRIGLIVKGCDLRSVYTLIRENQVPRENLVLIGVPCSGMIERKKMIESGTGIGIDSDGDMNPGDESLEKLLQDSCLECRFARVEGTDFIVDGEAREPGLDCFEIVRKFESETTEKRLKYFENEMSKCIRCHACRQACPSCYCRECFADQRELNWIGSGTLSDSMIYHLIRIFHQAGRCSECDACFRACPEGIDLRTFTKKLAKDVEEMFGFVTDFNGESIPPIATFSSEDKDSFITEPDRKGSADHENGNP